MLHADEKLYGDQEEDALGLVDLGRQAVDEGQPDNHKEEKQGHDEEGEDGEAGFLARGDT